MENPTHIPLSSITRYDDIQSNKTSVSAVRYHISKHQTLARHLPHNEFVFHDIFSDTTRMQGVNVKVRKGPINTALWRMDGELVVPTYHEELNHYSGASYQMEIYILMHIDTTEPGCLMGNVLATVSRQVNPASICYGFGSQNVKGMVFVPRFLSIN